ncbi:regulatory protein RecX [Alkalimarinus alittae]|uniref:Regulatory protein RecX n=1 Tax=Alkalimarinus alittae TaxID=2961619 RepID=A0ABY6MYM7_9ALTE|nr:regulatory protein RecX [Alkalimarinus alittae]UZE94905.1 recombination regulator RecX [Alkalimarinus alittae]
MNSSESECEQGSGMNKDELKDIKDRLIRALARREHSRYELKVKMVLKSFGEHAIERVLDELELEGVVSDARFAEAYCYHRRSRGFGPTRIASELRERQVSEVLVDDNLDETEHHWYESAAYQREKKFGKGRVADFTQKARQMRFLMQKGFNHDHISYAIKKVS